MNISESCEDVVIPLKTVKIYPNNKTWVSRHLKVLLNQKKQAPKQGNQLTSVQTVIKWEIDGGLNISTNEKLRSSEIIK